MIRKLAKIFPYWIVVKFIRNNFSSTSGKLLVSGGKEYEIKYFQINEGEFIVFSKELQDVFDKKRKDKKTKKINKKIAKINKKLAKDYFLEREFIRQIKDK